MTTKKNAPVIRTPPKLGTMPPESGPSAETVVDAAAPAPALIPEGSADPKVAKEEAKAQKVAENTKSARDVKVMATQPGYIGFKHRVEGDVFVLQLHEGQNLPSWVKAVTDDVPSTPLSHSSEAKEEVVDSKGIGHTTESLKKDLIK